MEGITKVKFVLTQNQLIGQPIYMAKTDIYSTIDEESIIEYASKAAGISQSDMIVTLEALLDAFSYYLCNGHSFKLDGIGTFSLSMKSSAADLYEENPSVGADAVNSIGVNFRPDRKLLNLIASLNLTTVTLNPNDLPEFTHIVPTRVAFGAKSANLLSHNPATALFCSAGDKVELGGYNLKEGMNLVVTGENNGETVGEIIRLGSTNKACNLVVGKATKSYTKITEVVIKDGENEVAVFSFSGESIITAYLGNYLITEGATFTVSTAKLSVRGNVEGVVVELDGARITPTSSSTTRLNFAETVGVGDHTIKVGETTYHFAVAPEAVANVTALSANGITVPNGGTSPVRSGQSYTFIATGQNLTLLSESDIALPPGATMSNFNKTALQVTFRVTFGESGGTIKVGNYRCETTMDESASAVVISSSTIANGGTVSEKRTITIEGVNLGNCVLYLDTTQKNFIKKTDTELQFEAYERGKYYVYSDDTKQECVYSITSTVAFDGNPSVL